MYGYNEIINLNQYTVVERSQASGRQQYTAQPVKREEGMEEGETDQYSPPPLTM